MLSKFVTALTVVRLVVAVPQLNARDGTPSVIHTSTASNDVAAAAATARTDSSTSRVKGKAFDRILQIYLETTAYENAISDCVYSWFLTNNVERLLTKGVS